VSAFVTEPIWNRVSGVTSRPVSTLATPKPFRKTTRSPFTTATAAPGRPRLMSSSRATRSSSTQASPDGDWDWAEPAGTIAVRARHVGRRRKRRNSWITDWGPAAELDGLRGLAGGMAGPAWPGGE
jgi:hypothetical protein